MHYWQMLRISIKKLATCVKEEVVLFFIFPIFKYIFSLLLFVKNSLTDLPMEMLLTPHESTSTLSLHEHTYFNIIL